MQDWIELANKANEKIGFQFTLDQAKQLHELMAEFGQLVLASRKLPEPKKVSEAESYEYANGWNACLSAVVKAIPVTQVTWQPIETAPIDNTRALYLARIGEKGEILELDYAGAWEYWQESWELSHINGYNWVSANGIEEPTHWAYQDGPPPMTTTLKDEV